MTNKEFRELIRTDSNIPDNYSLLYSLDFLDLLEDSYRSFEVCVDDDGDVTFDWIINKEDLLSISVNFKGELIYASIGRVASRGTLTFQDSIPETILNLIKEYSKEK